MLSVETDFKESLEKHLTEFVKSSNKQIGLPSGLTPFEEKACHEVGKSLDLDVHVRTCAGRRHVMFTKKI